MTDPLRTPYDQPDEDNDLCPVCGGDGYIMAYDGDGSDWGEDTYAGPMDAVINCRHCNSSGYLGETLDGRKFKHDQT